MKNKNAVELYNGGVVAGTLIISQGFERRHAEVLRLCRKFETELLSLADESKVYPMHLASRKITGRSDKPITEFLLNESQAMFLGMMFRAKAGNDDPVLRFKVNLAAEFTRLKKELIRVASQHQNAQWLEARSAGKETRCIATDTIKDFVAYATSQGSKNAERYYANISKMENKALFFLEQKYKNLRDALDIHQLSTMKSADMIVMKALGDGMAQLLPYKDVYKLAKLRVESFSEIIGKTLIPSSQLQISGK